MLSKMASVARTLSPITALQQGQALGAANSAAAPYGLRGRIAANPAAWVVQRDAGALGRVAVRRHTGEYAATLDWKSLRLAPKRCLMREPMNALANGARALLRPAVLPLVLLLGALSSVFLFGNDRGHFYRDGSHDWLTSQHLAQAVNLSLADRFLLFVDRTHDADGAPSYSTYGRWPVGSYALVKLAVLPFEGNLSVSIYAARVATLLLFAAAAVVAYLALARLVDRWVALTATLLAFSSQLALYYSDAFAPDAIPALFGLLLAFHGMVVFAQEKRFAQLLVKSCVALLLCWQVYALLLPFIVLGIARELFGGGKNSSSRLPILRRCGTVLRSSRHLRLGFATLGFGIVVLCFNFANEYLALNGKVPLAELPTVHSVGYRFGQDEDFNTYWAETLRWSNYLREQFHRIAVMALPYYSSLNGHLDAIGQLLVAYCCIGLAFVRYRTLFASLLVAGFVWALPFRYHVALHDFQGLFHIGVPLVAVCFAGSLLSRPLACASAGFAALLFVLSSVAMADVGHDAEQAKTESEMLRDFQVIRNIVGKDTVFIADEQSDDAYGGAPLASSYFLTGSFVEYESFQFGGPTVNNLIAGRIDLADYLISLKREDIPSLVTPENKRIFLYDRTCDRKCRETILTRFVTSDEVAWDAYLKDGNVMLVSEECINTDVPFFMHYVPVDRENLNDPQKRSGVGGVNFLYEDHKLEWDGQCAAKIKLPDFPLSHIRIGQFTDGQHIWTSETFVYQ